MRRLVACLCAATLLSACTGEDKSPNAAPTTAPGCEASAPKGKPKVTVPKGDVPDDVVKTDLYVGTGNAAVPGQVLSVHYVGVKHSDGKQFDASWDGGGHPFQFQLGAGDVIEGWDKGLLGMRVCGRRQLVIPPALAYGDAGELGGEALVFVVDLISASGSAGVIDEQPTG